MKKYLISISAVLAFAICCMFGITAYAAQDVSSVTVDTSTTYTYTGSAVEPAVTVYDSESGVVDSANYSVEYTNNTNAGTATVTVTGTGDYTGTASTTFDIASADINNATFSTFKVYAGKTPTVVATLGDYSLVSGTDYTISVDNGTTAGTTSTVTVTGTGNFTGTKTFSKFVYPTQVNTIVGTKRTTSSIHVEWRSQASEGVTGYLVYKCDNINGDNAKLYKTVTSNKIDIKDLKAGSYLYLKIRAYVTVNNTKYYGDYSKIYKTSILPSKVSIQSVTKSKDKTKLVVSWKKVSCSGYEVQYSTKKDFSTYNSVVYTGSDKVKASITIPSNSTTYYARVRAFRKFTYNKEQKLFNGSFSAKLSTSYSKLYATYTTSYVNKKNRTNNLKLACKAINGTIVYPGKTFSFNKTVGKRTKAKGYKAATIFTGSSGTAQSIGGGVCQVASTMFNTTLLANLKIVERHQHSQRVHYCPLGRDAAIYWGSEDFKFKNNTDYPIKITMKCSNGKLTCSYYVCYDVSPKKVKLKVTRSGSRFTLKRYVGGKCNYTTKSRY